MILNLHARKSIFAPAITGRISAAATRHVIAIALPIDPTDPKAMGRLRWSSSLHGLNASARAKPQDDFLGKTDPPRWPTGEMSPSGERITAVPTERRVRARL